MSKETPRCPVPFTTVPNCILDEWMHLLSRPAMEALLVIVREILGWEDRDEAKIPFTTFLERTHIAGRDTLTLALEELYQQNLVLLSSRPGKYRAHIYQLGPAFFSGPPTGLVIEHPKKEKKTKSGPATGPIAVKSLDHKQSSQHTNNGPATPPDKSSPVAAQDSQEEARDESKQRAKETLKETFSKKEERNLGASLRSRPDVLIEKEKEDGNAETQAGQEMTTGVGISSQPTDAPETAEQTRQRLEEEAARAEAQALAAKRREDMEQLQHTYQELDKAYEVLVKEELRLWGLVKRATPDSEEKAGLERELAGVREQMASARQEMSDIKQAYQRLQEG